MVYPEALTTKYAVTTRKTKRNPAKGPHGLLAAATAAANATRTPHSATRRDSKLPHIGTGYALCRAQSRRRIGRVNPEAPTVRLQEDLLLGAPSIDPTIALSLSLNVPANAIHDAKPFLNTNLYIKLLNAANDADAISRHLSRGGPESLKAFNTFLTSRLRKLQSLLSTAHRMCSQSDPERAMHLAIATLLEGVDAKHGCLYVVEEGSEEVEVRASSWVDVGSRIRLERVFCGEALARGGEGLVNVFNVKASEFFSDALEETYGGVAPECVLSAPVVVEDGEVAGILEVVNKGGGAPFFDAEDEFVIRAVASVLGLLIAHSNVRNAGMRRSDDTRMLLNTASLMSSKLNHAELLQMIMETARDLVGAEACSLFMVDVESREMWERPHRYVIRARLRNDSSLFANTPFTEAVGHVAMTGQPLHISNARDDPRFNRHIDERSPIRTRSILCIPMRDASGTVIGVTQVVNKRPDAIEFSKEDELLLLAFSTLGNGRVGLEDVRGGGRTSATIDKSLMFRNLEERLLECTSSERFLSRTLETLPLAVITLDSAGRMTHITHPSVINLTDIQSTMQLSPYDIWLQPNDFLIADIRRVYEDTELGPVFGSECVVIIEGTELRIDYFVARVGGDGGGLDGECVKSRAEGVVVGIQVLGKGSRVMRCLGR
ncbi:GAF domain-like protein [Blyttiomyces helicus]|uniref:GAF domain-like protein n=1 Tax=Blyttiomyces helicus TaxID=388810 RepID=A0A4P9VZ90_9FUNG|nr:GAF domain-like protein [Blyttiomyces helicus]|eukprot:RKO84093.1 GAF domain-like protein [Blyttiomyces helicus]